MPDQLTGAPANAPGSTLPNPVSAFQPVSVSAFETHGPSSDPISAFQNVSISAFAPSPSFPRHPGETPRAFAAFLAYFQLGQTRSLSAVADALGESQGTVKNWSSKYRWSQRLHDYYSGLAQAHAQTEAALQTQDAADWARRTRDYREQEWNVAEKLRTAGLCYLENLGDQEVGKMNLGQVSRALQISTRLSRQALRGDHVADDPAPIPHQTDLLAALKKAYGHQAPVAAAESQPAPTLAPPRLTLAPSDGERAG